MKKAKEYPLRSEELQIASEPDLTGHYNYGDYLSWRMDDIVELIRGKIFRMSPAPGTTHQRINGALSGFIWTYFRSNRECQFFQAPFDVILPVAGKKGNNSTTVVQPDLCVICDPSIIQERGCFGVPDWIIEIISPHTSKKDIQYKYDVYEEVGVREYWLVLPKSQIVTIYFLENKKYVERGRFVQSDIVSPILFPDLEINLPEVFGPAPEY